MYNIIIMTVLYTLIISQVASVADLGGFQGFHGTPLLASVMIEGYGSLAFNRTQLIRL